MEYFDVGGVRLAANVSGAPGAPALVLLHGGGASKSTWDAVAPALSATHRVYALDLRGFGDSDRPGKYSFETMRDDVLGFLDLIGARRVDLIGHSMGGTVAWLVAQHQPARLGHLVIVDSPPPRGGGERRPQPPRPDQELPFDWSALMAILEQLNDPDPDWWDRIGAVTSPTLLLAGGQASHVPQQQLREVLALLPHGRLVEIPAGHNLHRADPDRFLEAVIPFLAG